MEEECIWSQGPQCTVVHEKEKCRIMTAYLAVLNYGEYRHKDDMTIQPVLTVCKN